MNTIITHLDNERFPILEAESQPVSVPLSELDLEHIERMDATLRDLEDGAAGVAAVQIGYPKRIFLLRKDEENRVFINPTVIARSRETRKRPEACLSLPGLVVHTHRPKSVTIKYFDLENDEHTETFTGFWAQAVCHEMDHLNGTLLTRHLEAQYAKTETRTKFGMKVDAHRRKTIAKRRAKNKRAKR
jgi:peptide deformylase